jgi:hypothetical protein
MGGSVAVPLIAGVATGGIGFAAGATVATSLALGATAFSAIGAVQSGMQQAALMRYNAQVAEMNAQSARDWAQYEAKRQQEKSRAFLARQEAAFASNGVVGTEGSPLLMMADTAASAELDRLAIIHKGEVAAIRGQNEAAGMRWGADMAVQSGYMRAGASLLQGASMVANMNPGWFNQGSTIEPFVQDTTVPSGPNGELYFDP